MTNNNSYQPVDCNFHDRLLHFATFREWVKVVALLEGEERKFEARIKDVSTKDGAEFIYFDDGQSFRLDELVEVNGFLPNGSCRI